MPVLAGQWARQSVNLPLRIRLFTTHKLTKSRFPSRVLCPSDHPSRETIQPFALPNIAGSVEGLQGAALRTRGGAGARLQAGARVCNQCLATRRGRLKSLAARLQARLASCPRPQRPVSRGLPSRSRVCNSWPISAQDSAPHRALRALASDSNRGVIYSPTWSRDSARSASCSGQTAPRPFLTFGQAETTRRATRSCAPHS